MMKKVIWALAFVSIVSLVSSLCFPQGANASQVKIWDNGGADSNWSTPENWDPDGVPGSLDTAVFNNTSNTHCIVDVADVEVASLTLDEGYTETVTLKQDVVVSGDLTVTSGTLLCEGDTTAIGSGAPGVPHGEGIVINAANISVGVAGKISADGQGFAPNQGPGAGTGSHGGGGHGGQGGHRGGTGGSTYGSLSEPTSLGSGGDEVDGGKGGGAIKLVVTGNITVDGRISADGMRCAVGGSGGGAGGSIWLMCDTLAGSGLIAADGGGGLNATYSGGGGGGRISLAWASRIFDGTVRAKGGSVNVAVPGSNGTIWVPADKWSELWNSAYPVKGSIALAPNSHPDVPDEYCFNDLMIDSAATLECQGDPNDGINGSGVVINASSITIASTGAISADRLGFAQEQGPGVGTGTHGGGGHGGQGGHRGGTGGSTYGSLSEPTSLGSGGHYVDGGKGGGAIKLVVTGNITVDGRISADGMRCAVGGSGGGAGGSIRLICDTLAGSGLIAADGGGGRNATYSGGGGGGRISLAWASRTFDGTVRAKGGSVNVAVPGSNGTIWVSADKWSELWNSAYPVKGSIALAPNSHPDVPDEYCFSDLMIDSAATLECQGDPNDGTNGSGVVINASSITIASTGAISADRLGFAPNQGPGAGTGTHGGGGHGGQGGHRGGTGGSTYGSLSEPTSLGSGGHYVDGGKGGGAIKLVVTGNITVDGRISADGMRCAVGGSGGGAGGSIRLICDTLAGSGLIAADGGDGRNATYSGGGGGGRISLAWASRTFDGTLRAKGGYVGVADPGSNGTIWVPADKWSELWNSAYPVKGSIALAPNSHPDVPDEYCFNDLMIDSDATLECQGDPNDGTNGSGVVINASSITIASTGAISADRLGFAPNQGPGVGTGRHGGGGHGGRGGNGIDGTGGGLPYGSASEPTSLGSGGDELDGGKGAGAIKLVVTGNITVDGRISAYGMRCAVGGSGGGAAGSIWMICDTLAGSGLIAADGGGGRNATYSGGGGGGRIAVYFVHDLSSLRDNATVNGGALKVREPGEEGTIVWEALCNESGVTGNISASPDTLWPPNHEMIPVTIDISGLVTHNPDTVISITSVDITESSGQEAEETYGDDGYNFEPDYEITGDLTLNLRSERSGASTGRTYTVTVTATDCSGDYPFTTEVAVPHDKGT